MNNTTSINLRIDKELKQQAESLFARLGINMTTAMNIFLRQAVREQGLPFKVTAASEFDTIIPYEGNAKGYGSHIDYIIDSLRQSDMRVAEGGMKYYTADEIRDAMEALLNEKIQG